MDRRGRVRSVLLRGTGRQRGLDAQAALPVVVLFVTETVAAGRPDGNPIEGGRGACLT